MGRKSALAQNINEGDKYRQSIGKRENAEKKKIKEYDNSNVYVGKGNSWRPDYYNESETVPALDGMIAPTKKVDNSQNQSARDLINTLEIQRQLASDPNFNPNLRTQESSIPNRTYNFSDIKRAEYADKQRNANLNLAFSEQSTSDDEAYRRAMQNYGGSLNPNEISHEPQAEKPENRPWYQVRKALGVPYEVSKRDTTYDRDFDEFYQMRYRFGDMIDYDQQKQENVEHWRLVKDMIKNKYHWTDKEFDKRFSEYEKDRHANQALEDAARNAYEAENHPISETLESVLETPLSAFGGAANSIRSLYSNDVASKDNLSPLYWTLQKQATRNSVTDNIDSGLGKMAYGAGTNFADQALMNALGGKVGTGLLSGDIAGQGTLNALQRDIDPRKAGLTGLAQGAVSLPLNLIGLDVASATQGKNIVQSLGNAAISEGLEEIVEEGANKALDTIINLDKSELLSNYQKYRASGMSDNDAWGQVAKDVGFDLASAGLSGATFGMFVRGATEGSAKLVPELYSYAAEKLAEREYKKNKDVMSILNGVIDSNTSNVGDTSYTTPNDYRKVNGRTVVGKATVIPAQYTGNDPLPVQSKQNNDHYSIPDEVVNRASQNIDTEFSKGEKGFASRMKNIYKALFGDNNFRITNVDNLSINGEPYDVRVYKNIVGKVMGDHITPEKVSVLEDIDNIIRSSNYVGSGDAVNKTGVSRYDYFEKPITINGNNYLVTYAVEVHPSENKYRTHAIIDEIKIQQFSNDTGNLPNGNVVPGEKTAESSFNVTQNEQGVNNIVGRGQNSVPEFNEITQQSVNSQNANSPQMPILSELQRNGGEITAQDVNSQEVSDDFEMLNNTGLEKTSYDPNDFIITETVEPTDRGFVQDGRSRLVTNSAINADIISRYEYDNDPVLQDIATYAKHSNDVTFENAFNSVKENGAEILNGYLDGSNIIDSDKDVDQAMILLQNLSDQFDYAKDADEKAFIKSQRDLLLARLRKQATKWGQDIQALAKWNDTADGALINGDWILGERVKQWKSRNQNSSDKNERVAKELSNISATVGYDGTTINNGANYRGERTNANQTNTKLDNALRQQGYDGSMDIPQEPKTREQLRREVVNSLQKEYGSVEGQFSDQDIDYITNLIAEGATTEELTNALDTKFATGAFGISAETQKKVNELFKYASDYDPNSIESAQAKAAAYKLIADEVVGKAKASEKFEAWRYLAMLGNPKTIIRNLVGNMTFNALTGVSNSLSGMLEAGTNAAVIGGKKLSNKLFNTNYDTSQGIQRTKSLLLPNKNDRSLVKAAWGDSISHRYNEMEGSKYNDSVKNKIRQSKSVFNSKWAQLYEKATDAGVSDMLAVRAKYSTSLAGYLKANGIDESIFDADERYGTLQRESNRRVLTEDERMELEDLQSSHEQLEKARDYAVEQAEYATFHEDNAVASLLSDFSRKARGSKNKVAKGFGYIFEGVMPFKKTPANIVRSGYEYSPFGAISSIAKTGKLIYENTGKRKGEFADTYTNRKGEQVNKTLASDVIESWARTLTGTGLMALGYYLRNKGILNSSNKDEKYQDELEGKQNYSITINGHTYTIDWAAPASMSLLMGAELSKIFENNAISSKSAYNNFGDVVGIVNTLLDPIVETSMMQGVKNTLESAADITRYNDAADAGLGILGTMAANAGTNYLTQAVPTILGQVARVVDPTRRSTDTVAEDSFWSGMEKQGRKLMNKIPGLSYLNEPYVNARGEEELNSPSANPLISIPYQFLSPGYLQKIEQTDADKSARNVYNALVPGKDGQLVPQMDKSVFEPWKSKITVGDHKFTPEEMHDYRQISGQAGEKIRTELAKSDWFNTLNPQVQNDILKKVNSFIDKLGKDSLGYPQDDKALDVYKNGGENAIPDLLDYYKESAIKKQVKEQTGLSTSSTALKEITQDIMSGNTESANQKMSEAIQKQEEVKPYSDLAETLGTDAKTVSQVANYAGDNWNAVESELPVLKGMGLSNYSQYAHAVNYASSNGENINTQWFADQTKLLDTDKSGGVNQEELKNYFNENGLSENEVMRLWGMFALGKDGAETKAVPYIITRGANKGKWGYK